MTDIDTLIERVRGLEGPSREVDAAIDATLRVGSKSMHEQAPWAWKNFPIWQPSNQRGMCEVAHSNGKGGLCWDSQPFTASLDAVVALIERELPPGDFDMWSRGGSTKAEVYWSEDESAKAVHKSRAIALLLAFLTAMKEKPDA